MSETTFNEQFISSSQEEHVTPDKQTLWEQRSTEVDKITDRLGKGIDSGIKETIVALNVLDINTISSCEGHLDVRNGAPWVEIQAPEVDELQPQMHEAFERAQATAIQQNTSPFLLFAKAHELRLEVKRRNLQEAEKAMRLLEQFYQNRHVPFDRQLMLNIFPTGDSILQSQGAELQDIAPPETKRQKLMEYQEEMAAFSLFLKDKYFSS